MNTVLAILALAVLVTAVAARLEANHRRVTAWPSADDGSDRDAVRLRADVAAARSVTAPGAARPRVVHGAGTGRRIAPPSVRAA